MRITYRSKNNREYWADRWEQVSIDAKMENPSVYPLKYAAMTVQSRTGAILEAGCGAGRILRYYHEAGYRITGIDFIPSVIERLKKTDPMLDVRVGDITSLDFADCAFRYVLAYGLYHNLEVGLDTALAETYRVLEPGGRLCASFRADNLQTWLTDRLSAWHDRRSTHGERHFHKLNLTLREITRMVSAAGFAVEQTFPVENMPILYKFAFLRAKGHKIFDESRGRKEGYRLSFLGTMLQKTLIHSFPSQFCNLYVIIARRD